MLPPGRELGKEEPRAGAARPSPGDAGLLLLLLLLALLLALLITINSYWLYLVVLLRGVPEHVRTCSGHPSPQRASQGLRLGSLEGWAVRTAL